MEAVRRKKLEFKEENLWTPAPSKFSKICMLPRPDANTLKKKYGILSEYFFDAYTNGWLDDDGNLDFAEWAGYYKSKQDRLRRYRALMLRESPLIKSLDKFQLDETIA